MKKIIKSLAIVLVLCIMSTILPLSVFNLTADAAANKLTETSFVDTLNYLRSKYPNGSTYSGTYYENGAAKAWQCMGYACQMLYEVFNVRFYSDGYHSKKDYNMGTIYAGDFVRLDAGYGPDTHSVFVTKVTSERIYFTDANFNNKNGIRWDASYTKSDFAKRFTYKVHIQGNTLTGNGTQTTVTNPWIKISKNQIFSGENINFTFGANNATSYKLVVKHLSNTVLSENNVKSGVSYKFDEEGTYTAYITASKGNVSVNSSEVSFYVVNALDMGNYFVAKLNNPVSGFYVSAGSLGSTTSYPNVYLANKKSNSNNEWRFIRQEDCSYKIINVQTGYCLAVQDGNTENGTNIVCLPNDNSDSQRWYIRNNIDGYALVSKLNLSRDLSITGNNWIYGECIFDGANISLYSNDSVQSQRFKFEYTVSPQDDWIKINKTKFTSAEKVKFDFGAGYVNKYELYVQYMDETVLKTVVKPGDSFSFNKSGKHTAYVVCTLKDGTAIKTDTVTFYNMLVHDLGKSFNTKIMNVASDFYVAADDNNVLIASEKFCNNNIWRFDKQQDGSYIITNVKTRRALDLYDKKVVDKTNIVCNAKDNSDTQKWFITSNVDGYALAPKNDYTKYLSVFDKDTIWWYGAHTDGANIVLYDLDNVQSQRFEFVDYKCNHMFYNSCDTACDDCGATRTIKHNYGTKTKVTKATLTANGKIQNVCSVCGYVSAAGVKTVYSLKSIAFKKATTTYDGTTKRPSVVVKDSKGRTISSSYYTISYPAMKYVGKYKVKVTFKGNYSGYKYIYYTIKPQETKITSVSAGSKKLTVKYSKKSSHITGYQIQYSTSKKFSSAKTKTVSSYKTTSATLSKLSAKKTYYVRVRTYKKVGKTYFYSGWSSVKSYKLK